MLITTLTGDDQGYLWLISSWLLVLGIYTLPLRSVVFSSEYQLDFKFRDNIISEWETGLDIKYYK